MWLKILNNSKVMTKAIQDKLEEDKIIIASLDMVKESCQQRAEKSVRESVNNSVKT